MSPTAACVRQASVCGVPFVTQMVLSQKAAPWFILGPRSGVIKIFRLFFDPTGFTGGSDHIHLIEALNLHLCCNVLFHVLSPFFGIQIDRGRSAISMVNVFASAIRLTQSDITCLRCSLWQKYQIGGNDCHRTTMLTRHTPSLPHC